MEGFGDFIKNLTILLVIIFIIIFTGVYFKDKHFEESYINEIENYKNKINDLETNISEYEILLDSLITKYDKSVDSLNNIKQKTITIYEKQEADFSNTAIVDDDSIIRFITAKIQN